MSFTQLALSLIFVAIPFSLALYLKLGLEKDIIIATVRSIIQLLIIRYILTFVLKVIRDIHHLMILLMIGAPSQNVVKRFGVPGITLIIIFTLVVVEAVTMGIPASASSPQNLSRSSRSAAWSSATVWFCRSSSWSKFKDELNHSEEVVN